MELAQDETMIKLKPRLLESKFSKLYHQLITSYRGVSFIHLKIKC